MLLKRFTLSCTALLIAIGGLEACNQAAEVRAASLLREGLRQGLASMVSERQGPRFEVRQRPDGSRYAFRNLDSEEQARQRALKTIEALRFGPEDIGRLRVVHSQARVAAPPAGLMLAAQLPVPGEWGWSLSAEIPQDALRAHVTGPWPALRQHWFYALVMSAMVGGLLWVAARLPREPQRAKAGEAPPIWSNTISRASPESIARLEALTRDNEHLKQELLARGEQLKLVTDGVKQRREAQHPASRVA